jgi:tRNA pseudouridine38-40 synthase
MIAFKLTLEYDGSRYAGWQMQQKEKTIQGELFRVAEDLFKTKPVEIYAAGRTDAGVHALGQVAHLKIASTKLTPDQIKTGLNDHLPSDINILNVEQVPVTFHARHNAKSRSYVYVISKRRDAFAKKHVWWVKETLDVTAMQEAAALMVGFHDFRSFGHTKKDDEQSTMVDLTALEIHEDAERINIRIVASHFLWKMVRRVVGVLVDAGRKNITAADIQRYFETVSDDPGKVTAPPNGLFLEAITY